MRKKLITLGTTIFATTLLGFSSPVESAEFERSYTEKFKSGYVDENPKNNRDDRIDSFLEKGGICYWTYPGFIDNDGNKIDDRDDLISYGPLNRFGKGRGMRGSRFFR
jgi:hypothetical protein